MNRARLKEVEDLKLIRETPFPADVAFRQLVVTGPPGTGKTTLVTAIGGWPDEGYVDLTTRNWWRARALTFRPRQIHLGMPFQGHGPGLSMFEPEWLDAPSLPVLDLDRVRLPPLGGTWNPGKWRRKYVFYFLLPPALAVFAARRERLDRQSHAIDTELSLDRVEAQLEAYWAVALHFHHAGMLVYVRDQFGGPPNVFDEPSAASTVEARMARGGASRRSLVESYLKRIISPSGYRVLDRFDRVELHGKKALVPRRSLPIEVKIGPQTLRVYAERPRQPRGAPAEGIRVFDPGSYFTGVAPFARLLPEEMVRIPGAHAIAPELPAHVPPRIEITNEGAWLAVVDLDSPTGIVLTALHEADEANRLVRDRAERLERLSRILNGMPPWLPRDEAAANFDAAIEVLTAGECRPRNSAGEPGGLVELPDHVTPIIVGDLHAEVDNLILILVEGRTLDALERGDAALILLGDAVHPEEEAELAEMGSSLLMMDIIARLISAFPGRVFYLRGNHDTFSDEMTKGGVSQGRVWRDKVAEVRGEEGVDRLQRFYDRLPYVAVGAGFVACHAGPPRGAVSRQALIEVHSDPKLAHQLTWTRVQTVRSPGGYTKRDVRALQRVFDDSKSSVLIVSHNPGVDESTAIRSLGGINRHDLVYSAKRDRVSIMTRFGGAMIPLTYPGSRLLDALPDRSASVPREARR